MDAERRGEVHMKAPGVEGTGSTASTLEDATTQAHAMTQEERQTKSSPIYKEEPGTASPSSRDLHRDFALLKESAEKAIKAKQRGVMGKISLGSSWNPELYELLIDTMPAGHKFELRGTEIWYKGDPQGVHELATREFARGVAAYMRLVPVHCRGSTRALKHKVDSPLQHGFQL